jgi:hypothetical protein
VSKGPIVTHVPIVQKDAQFEGFDKSNVVLINQETSKATTNEAKQSKAFSPLKQQLRFEKRDQADLDDP